METAAAPDVEVRTAFGLRFLVSLPEETAERPPLICFLHGYDEGAPVDIMEGVMRHGPLSRSRSRLSTQLFVIVAPQLPRKGDLWPYYVEEVAAIVREVQKVVPTDPERSYLTGFSFGGNGVFDVAIEHPSLFAALWPVDPTRVPAVDPGLPVWFSSGQVSRMQREAFTMRLGLQKLRVEASGDRIYMDEGLDHVGTAASAYADDSIYRWLLAHRR